MNPNSNDTKKDQQPNLYHKFICRLFGQKNSIYGRVYIQNC